VNESPAANPMSLRRPVIAAAFSAVTLLGVTIASPASMLVFLLDLPWAACALLPGFALGVLVLPMFRLGKVSRSWHLVLSAGLGIGLWSQIVLLLGLGGLLDRRLFLVIVGASAVVLILHALSRRNLASADGGPPEDSCRQSQDDGHVKLRWLWLCVAPFLILSILSAANAPGFLWKEEGFGYDVLEYHLQLPREYFEAGRISYCAHNVYANFPANVEMLYLAAMALTGAPQDTGTICHLIHLFLGVMFVAATWRAAAQWSPRAGVVAGVLAGTVGWLPYLSGLAYVELGMLFFGAAAMACVVRGHGATKPRSHEGGWIALAGVLAGFACGCKYTALPLVAAPLGVMIVALWRGWAERAKALALFGLGAAAAFSPWLIKNAAMTGNPVFPLAQRVFQAAPPGWGAEETAKWNRGHFPRADKSDLGDRLAALWRNLPGDHLQRLGPALFVLALVGLLGSATEPRSHGATKFGLMVVLMVQLLVWTFATHLFARFAVVMLIPLALLGGAVGCRVSSKAGRGVLAAVVVVGAAWNFYFAARLHAREAPAGAPATLFYVGQVPGFEYLGMINRELSVDAKILMVGEARPFYVRRSVDYCVVFNRSPFVAAVESGKSAADITAWLRERGYSHVLVHWKEIARLRRTYGFSERVNEALFDALVPDGLKKVREFSIEGIEGRYVSLYEVVGG